MKEEKEEKEYEEKIIQRKQLRNLPSLRKIIFFLLQIHQNFLLID